MAQQTIKDLGPGICRAEDRIGETTIGTTGDVGGHRRILGTSVIGKPTEDGIGEKAEPTKRKSAARRTATHAGTSEESGRTMRAPLQRANPLHPPPAFDSGMRHLGHQHQLAKRHRMRTRTASLKAQVMLGCQVATWVAAW